MNSFTDRINVRYVSVWREIFHNHVDIGANHWHTNP